MHSITSIKFNHLSHNPVSSNFGRNQISVPCYYWPQNSPNKNNNMVVVNAKKRDNYDGKDRAGRLVDENMIILRMRIRDIKTSSEVVISEVPWYWMKWEKKWYDGKYNSDICEAMGIFQRLLMDARPGLVVALLALFMLSIFMSCALLLAHLLPLLGCT